MKDIEHIKLPQEILKFFINFSTNKEDQFKIVLGGYKEGEHLTLGFYNKSKTIDIHTKNEVNGEYQSIFKMNYLRFFVIIKNFNPVFQYLILDLLKGSKINPGKLGKHKLWMCLQDEMEEKHPDILRFQKNKTKIRVNHNKNLLDLIDDLQPAQNIKSYQDGLALLYDGNLNYKGFLLKFESFGTFFISKKKWNLMSKKMMICLFNYLIEQAFYRKDKALTSFRDILQEKYPLLT